MKKSRYNEEQIIAVVKESQAGIPTAELCRRHGIRDATFCNWKAKFSGMTGARDGAIAHARR